MSSTGPPPLARLSPLLRLAHRAFSDLLYPRACAACNRPLGATGEAQQISTWFCPPCAAALPWTAPPCCERCGESYDGAMTRAFRCSNCEGLRFYFDFATAACVSRDSVREMVHGFKYGGQAHLRGALATLILHSLHEEPRLARQDLADWLLVPVPLHPVREVERGYNQSWELCTRLSRLTGMLAVEALDRKRETRTQARLTRRERLENLRGAFCMRPTRFWRKAVDVRGRSLLLIDDVLTTGSTANECARVLTQEGGAERVIVITVARG